LIFELAKTKGLTLENLVFILAMHALPSSLAKTTKIFLATKSTVTQGTITFPALADLFSAIRKAVIKTSDRDTGGSTSALFASKTKSGSGTSNRGPPPGPCPACKQIHWLVDCKHLDTEKKQVEIAAAKKAREDAATKAKEKEGVSAHLANVKSESAALTSTASTKGASSNIANIGDFAYTHEASALVAVGAKDKKIVGAVILNCGASACFTGNTSILCNIKTIKPMEINGIVPGARASKVGTLDLRTIDGKIVTLGTVFFVESLSYTLISTAVLTKTFNVEIKISDHQDRRHHQEGQRRAPLLRYQLLRPHRPRPRPS